MRAHLENYLLNRAGTDRGLRSNRLRLTFHTRRDEQGRLHAEDGPAVVVYYSNGQVRCMGWYRHGVLHREDGPAEIIFSPDGKIIGRSFYINGKPHGVDEVYDEVTGELIRRSLYNEGKLVRKEIYREGKLVCEEFCQDEKRIRREYSDSGKLVTESVIFPDGRVIFKDFSGGEERVISHVFERNQ